MKKLLVLFIMSLALLSGCMGGNQTSQQSQGSITLSILASLTAKTLTPGLDMNVATYDIYGSGPHGTSFRKNNVTGSTVNIGNLAAGVWKVTVDAKNAAGTIIGSGTGEGPVVANQNNGFPITVNPLTGNGTLKVAVNWPTGVITSPSVTGTLTPVGGAGANVSFTLGTDGLSASYENLNLAAGYYTLAIQLKDGTVVKWGSIESVRILSGQMTEGAFNLTATPGENGEGSWNIIFDLRNPITITFDGQVDELPVGTEMTVTAAPSDGMDSYQWYLNGKILAEETQARITIGKSLAPGSYRLDLVVIKGNIASSGFICFTVIADAHQIKNVNTGICYQTIQAAIDAGETVNGHTIQITAGTYTENFSINKSITITGKGADQTIIQASSANANVCYITANNVNISGVTIQGASGNSRAAICLQSVTGVIISNSTIQNSFFGLNLVSASNNQVLNNRIVSNYEWGIQCHPNSCNNKISGNTISQTINAGGINTGDGSSSGTIIENNLVYSNKQTGICGYLGSNNMQIQGNTVYSNGGEGIAIGWSSGCVVENNTVYANGSRGIFLDAARNTTVRNNEIHHNTGGGVLDWWYTGGNVIELNNIHDNQYFGVSMSSHTSSAVVRSNLIQNNAMGVTITAPDASNHQVYHNNIINNTQQSEDAGSGNLWDNGSEGNYWSDYTGTDGDGNNIGDTPYTIPGTAGKTDRYPLMNQYQQ